MQSRCVRSHFRARDIEEGCRPVGHVVRRAAFSGWWNSYRVVFRALGPSIHARGAAFDISEVVMSRTYVRRVAAMNPRADGSKRDRRARNARTAGLTRALAGAVEMLEQRWFLSGEGLQGSYFAAANKL